MTNERFRIEGRLVDVSLGRVSAGSTSVHLEPQVMKVLAYLAGRPRQVVTKDELLGTLWKGGFASDAALARCISRIRIAFGDDARQPRVVETIPKVGYRLIADVLPAERGTPRRHSGIGFAAAAAGIAIAIAVAGLVGHRGAVDASRVGDDAALEAYQKGRSLHDKYTYPYNQNAIAHFEKALQIDPAFGRAYAGLAEALVQEAHYWGGKRVAEAVRYAERAVLLEPELAESHRAHGKALAAGGDEDAALAAFARALELDPGDWVAALQSANLHFARLEFDAAEKFYLDALQHAPRLDAAMSSLGYLYLKSGNVDSARLWFERALELYPLQQRASARLAMLEMFTGHPEQALARCSRLVESYPQDYACLQVLAVASLIRDDLDSAREGFSQVLDNYPGDRYARLGLARVELGRQRPAEAHALANEVLTETLAGIETGEPGAYDYWLLAACHALLGDPDAAYAWFDRAAQAGRRFALWDAADPIFMSLRGDSRFDRYIAATSN